MYPRLKRLIDILGASLGLILAAPVMLAVALAVRVTMGSPILFRQRRPGLHGQIFHCFKFRTMTDERDESGELLPDDQRLKPFGLFLRRTSLDELPQFWNILRGDASFVGPRPLMERYLPWYTPEESRRHDVRPGLTGWAQVNGRNDTGFDERLIMDVWYVDHMSFWLDMTILFRTISIVLTQKGIALNPAEIVPLDVQRSQALMASGSNRNRSEFLASR